ncbi:MAG: hypothetical protein AAF292_14695 [Pseudomonadota bacterium]
MRLWLGAAGAAAISVLSVPAMAEAETVRIIKADGASLDGEAPNDIEVVNRRSKIIFVDAFEFEQGLSGGPSGKVFQQNLIRVGEASRAEITVYRGGQKSSSRHTNR